MEFPKKWVAAIMLISVGAFAATGGVPQPARGAAPEPVKVVNTPLPVQGDVDAKQEGPWTVGLNPGTIVGLAPGSTVNLAGPVTIGNSASNPVLTREVLQPLRIKFAERFTNGATTHNSLGTVPSGQLWVIEHVSIFLPLVSGSQILGVAFETNLGIDYDPLPVQLLSKTAGVDTYVGNAQTKLYAFPGESVTFAAETDTLQNLSALIVPIGYAAGYALPYP